MGNPVTATGATTGWTNAVPLVEAPGFYRVVLLPSGL
jgi:hypothetical protein